MYMHIRLQIFWCGTGVNEKGLSKKHIDEGINNSLARLQLSYVDLLFCHRPDPLTPTETVVRAMTDVVRSGKVSKYIICMLYRMRAHTYIT